MDEKRPDESSISGGTSIVALSRESRLNWLLSATIAVGVTLGVMALATIIRFGSIREGIEFANGVRLSVDETTKSFGIGSPRQRVGVSFRLTNLGGDAIRILGTQTDCSCVARDEEPFELAAGQSRTFDLSVELPRNVGPVERSVVLFTDVPGQEQINLAVIGRVEARMESP